MEVKSGTGGTGLPRYGGIGGKGGSIILRANEKVTMRSLASATHGKMIKASNGCNSERKGIIGKPGDDVTIDVPVGISVFSRNGILKGKFLHPFQAHEL